MDDGSGKKSFKEKNLVLIREEWKTSRESSEVGGTIEEESKIEVGSKVIEVGSKVITTGLASQP